MNYLRSKFGSFNSFKKIEDQRSGALNILYVGRIHRHKQIEVIIKGISHANRNLDKPALLNVVRYEDRAYFDELVLMWLDKS